MRPCTSAQSEAFFPVGWLHETVYRPVGALGACVFTWAASGSEDVANCYLPVEGGWHIRIDGKTPLLKAGKTIGVVVDDARAHRRPLYPPADRTMVWNRAELAERQRIPFRPLILAANEPRFVIDLDSAGGLNGHLLVGLSLDGGPSKWLHQFSDLDVRYVEGRMEYALDDAAFPGICVRLAVLPLAESVGLVMKGAHRGRFCDRERFVWTFGGASGFTTNYDHDGPQFRFSPEQCADNVIREENDRFTLLRGQVAVLRGGSSWTGGLGLGDPKKVLDSPAALCASAQWCPAAQAVAEPKRVAVQKARLGKETLQGWLVIGRGGPIESFLTIPREAEKLAQARSRAICQRIVVHTPDAHLNQAMPMMALATDAIWGDAAFVHGGWSWRQAYLGWRTGTDRCATAGRTV